MSKNIVGITRMYKYAPARMQLRSSYGAQSITLR